MQSKGELESQLKRIVENEFLEGVDIKSYLDAQFPPAKGKVYLRNGNAQGKFKGDYYVAVTPEVADRGDGVKTLDHFLGCSRDDAYTAILRYFLQNYPANCTEDNITQQAMTINPRLGNPEEKVYQRSLNITKDNIRHYIQSEDSIKKAIQQKESPDVFNDLSDILLNNEEAKIKILSPFNEGRGHWLTSEIVILKLATTTPTYNYKVNISLHDPLKAAKALDHNYLKLIKEAIEARLTQIHDVKILIEMNVIDSPFKIKRQVETNKTSCGAIVAHEIEQRVNDEPLEDVTDDKKAKILRQEMLDVIQPPTKKNINVALSMTVAEDNNTRDGIATLPLTSSSSSSSSLGSQRVIPLASPSSVSSSASPSSSTLAANAPVPGMTPTTHTQTTTTPTAPESKKRRTPLEEHDRVAKQKIRNHFSLEGGRFTEKLASHFNRISSYTAPEFMDIAKRISNKLKSAKHYQRMVDYFIEKGGKGGADAARELITACIQEASSKKPLDQDRLNRSLMMAAKLGDRELFNLAYNKGAKLYSNNKLAVDETGKNLLHYACQSDDVDLVAWIAQTMREGAKQGEFKIPADSYITDAVGKLTFDPFRIRDDKTIGSIYSQNYLRSIHYMSPTLAYKLDKLYGIQPGRPGSFTSAVNYYVIENKVLQQGGFGWFMGKAGQHSHYIEHAMLGGKGLAGVPVASIADHAPDILLNFTESGFFIGSAAVILGGGIAAFNLKKARAMRHNVGASKDVDQVKIQNYPIINALNENYDKINKQLFTYQNFTTTHEVIVQLKKFLIANKGKVPKKFINPFILNIDKTHWNAKNLLKELEDVLAPDFKIDLKDEIQESQNNLKLQVLTSNYRPFNIGDHSWNAKPENQNKGYIDKVKHYQQTYSILKNAIETGDLYHIDQLLKAIKNGDMPKFETNSELIDLVRKLYYFDYPENPNLKQDLFKALMDNIDWDFDIKKANHQFDELMDILYYREETKLGIAVTSDTPAIGQADDQAKVKKSEWYTKFFDLEKTSAPENKNLENDELLEAIEKLDYYKIHHILKHSLFKETSPKVVHALKEMIIPVGMLPGTDKPFIQLIYEGLLKKANDVKVFKELLQELVIHHGQSEIGNAIIQQQLDTFSDKYESIPPDKDEYKECLIACALLSSYTGDRKALDHAIHLLKKHYQMNIFDIQDNKGSNILHSAARAQNSDMIKHILANTDIIYDFSLADRNVIGTAKTVLEAFNRDHESATRLLRDKNTLSSLDEFFGNAEGFRFSSNEALYQAAQKTKGRVNKAATATVVLAALGLCSAWGIPGAIALGSSLGAASTLAIGIHILPGVEIGGGLAEGVFAVLAAKFTENYAMPGAREAFLNMHHKMSEWMNGDYKRVNPDYSDRIITQAQKFLTMIANDIALDNFITNGDLQAWLVRKPQEFIAAETDPTKKVLASMAWISTLAMITKQTTHPNHEISVETIYAAAALVDQKQNPEKRLATLQKSQEIFDKKIDALTQFVGGKDNLQSYVSRGIVSDVVNLPKLCKHYDDFIDRLERIKAEYVHPLELQKFNGDFIKAAKENAIRTAGRQKFARGLFPSKAVKDIDDACSTRIRYINELANKLEAAKTYRDETIYKYLYAVDPAFNQAISPEKAFATAQKLLIKKLHKIEGGLRDGVLSKAANAYFADIGHTGCDQNLLKDALDKAYLQVKYPQPDKAIEMREAITSYFSAQKFVMDRLLLIPDYKLKTFQECYANIDVTKLNSISSPLLSNNPWLQKNVQNSIDALKVIKQKSLEGDFTTLLKKYPGLSPSQAENNLKNIQYILIDLQAKAKAKTHKSTKDLDEQIKAAKIVVDTYEKIVKAAHKANKKLSGFPDVAAALNQPVKSYLDIPGQDLKITSIVAKLNLLPQPLLARVDPLIPDRAVADAKQDKKENADVANNLKRDALGQKLKTAKETQIMKNYNTRQFMLRRAAADEKQHVANNRERDPLVQGLKTAIETQTQEYALRELKITLAKYPKLFAIVERAETFNDAIGMLQKQFIISQEKRIGLNTLEKGLNILKRPFSHTPTPDEAVKALTEVRAAIYNLAPPVMNDVTKSVIRLHLNDNHNDGDDNDADNKIKGYYFAIQLKQLDDLTKIARKDPLIAFLKKYDPVKEFNTGSIKKHYSDEHLLNSYLDKFNLAQDALTTLRENKTSLDLDIREANVVQIIKDHPILSITGASQKVRELNEIIMMLEEKSYEYENLIGSDVEEWETNAGLKYDALLQEAKTLRKGYQAILDGANVVYSQLSHYDNIVANLTPPIELDDSPALDYVKKKLKEWDEYKKTLQTSPPPTKDSKSSLTLRPRSSSSSMVSTSTQAERSPAQETEFNRLLSDAIIKAKNRAPYHALATDFLSKTKAIYPKRGESRGVIHYVENGNDFISQSHVILPAGVFCASAKTANCVPIEDTIDSKCVHKIMDIIDPQSTLHVYQPTDAQRFSPLGSFKVEKKSSDYTLSALTMDPGVTDRMAVQINAMLESFVALNGAKQIVIQGQNEAIIMATILACKAFGLEWKVANDSTNSYKDRADELDATPYRTKYAESYSSINMEFVAQPKDLSLKNAVDALNNMYNKDSNAWTTQVPDPKAVVVPQSPRMS